MFITKFETVVYEKLIEIVRRNKSIYDSFMNELKDFILQKNIRRRIGREMGMDALTLANLAELDAILIVSIKLPLL